MLFELVYYRAQFCMAVFEVIYSILISCIFLFFHLKCGDGLFSGKYFLGGRSEVYLPQYFKWPLIFLLQICRLFDQIFLKTSKYCPSEHTNILIIYYRLVHQSWIFKSQLSHGHCHLKADYESCSPLDILILNINILLQKYDENSAVQVI